MPGEHIRSRDEMQSIYSWRILLLFLTSVGSYTNLHIRSKSSKEFSNIDWIEFFDAKFGRKTMKSNCYKIYAFFRKSYIPVLFFAENGSYVTRFYLGSCSNGEMVSSNMMKRKVSRETWFACMKIRWPHHLGLQRKNYNIHIYNQPYRMNQVL